MESISTICQVSDESRRCTRDPNEYIAVLGSLKLSAFTKCNLADVEYNIISTEVLTSKSQCSTAYLFAEYVLLADINISNSHIVDHSYGISFNTNITRKLAVDDSECYVCSNFVAVRSSHFMESVSTVRQILYEGSGRTGYPCKLIASVFDSCTNSEGNIVDIECNGSASEVTACKSELSAADLFAEDILLAYLDIRYDHIVFHSNSVACNSLAADDFAVRNNEVDISCYEVAGRSSFFVESISSAWKILNESSACTGNPDQFSTILSAYQFCAVSERNVAQFKYDVIAVGILTSKLKYSTGNFVTVYIRLADLNLALHCIEHINSAVA